MEPSAFCLCDGPHEEGQPGDGDTGGLGGEEMAIVKASSGPFYKGAQLRGRRTFCELETWWPGGRRTRKGKAHEVTAGNFCTFLEDHWLMGDMNEALDNTSRASDSPPNRRNPSR